MKDPNTIKIYYPDGTVMTPGYETISDLIEGMKSEARNLLKRYRYKMPMPRKIIITFDRRIK